MTKAITIYLPDRIYAKARTLADQQNLELHELLLQSISLPDADFADTQCHPHDAGGPSEQVILEEEQAFRQMHSTLVEQYPGEYVAIRNGQVVDHDAGQTALYLRVRQNYPGRFVLIAATHGPLEETYHFRSPRVIE